MARLRQIPVTIGLIAICVALYLVTSNDPSLLDQYGDWGAGIQFLGQWYRLFTSIFLHVDFLHITLNMVSLLIIGRLVEPAFGKWRYLALFLVSGLGGSVVSYLIANPRTVAVGASGAIFGLFGAYFVLARRAAASTSGILILIAINLFYSFSIPGISWQGHIGGLLTGLVLAAGFGLGRHRPNHVEVAADVAVLVGCCIVLGLLMLLPAGAVHIG
ncbi:MAG: rhomboid family intramembrane serine protease [Acidimicrobiales bacterium]